MARTKFELTSCDNVEPKTSRSDFKLKPHELDPHLDSTSVALIYFQVTRSVQRDFRFSRFTFRAPEGRLLLEGIMVVQRG